MIALPDPRYETACDHLQQALAILPHEGCAVIRLLVQEAARCCEIKAYGDVAALIPLPDPKDEE